MSVPISMVCKEKWLWLKLMSQVPHSNVCDSLRTKVTSQHLAKHCILGGGQGLQNRVHSVPSFSRAVPTFKEGIAKNLPKGCLVGGVKGDFRSYRFSSDGFANAYNKYVLCFTGKRRHTFSGHSLFPN